MATTQPSPQTLTPQQVKQMQMIVKQALGHLLDSESAAYLVKRAEATDPVTTTAQAVAPVLKTIYASASESGVKIDMVVVLAAGIQIIAMMGKMLESQGLMTEEQIPKFCADVAKIAVSAHNAEVPAPEPAPAPAGMMGAQGVPQ